MTPTAVEGAAADLAAEPRAKETPPETVSRLLDRAVRMGASDLFFSAEERDFAVSVRHLGVIRPLCGLDAEYGRHCAAHLRAEADMEVAEHRRPHDGRWAYRTSGGKVVDLRICSMPTLYGEDIAVRILDRETALLRLDRVGLSAADHDRLLRLLASPGGLILVTGPTGSGKTTTLYACFRHLNDGRRRIHTIEDPIEYAVAGIHQTQANPKLGLHFPDLLRGIIRQGPDVIMVGEIRDPETAQTAVSAANSGHLVLGTLHAPIAAGAVASMLAFGVAPHFLATSLIGAVSQRLVRTFCPACRFPTETDPPGKPPLRYGAPGCPMCHHTGYAARTALFEVLEVSRTIRRMIQDREPAQVIEEEAYRGGMIGLAGAARALVERGLTDFAEVTRRIPAECLRGDDAAPAG